MIGTRDVAAPTDLDVERIRRDFPALHQTVHGKPLVYLDNAATSQKPQVVIDALRAYYESENANVHRGVHYLSQQATDAFEGARARVQRFLGAAADGEIVFVRGTTEGINLVAASYGRRFVRTGDEIIISGLEHHSNIVPWQLLCEATGAVLRVIPLNDDGELVLEEYEKLLSRRTRLVAVAHVSNALGTIVPVARIIELAHRYGAPVLLDGAQAAPHLPVDVRALDCDFYVFSGHKALGPTGHRRPLWQGRVAGAHAAVSGGRRHDPLRQLREDALQGAAVPVRGRHAAHWGRHRARCGARLPGRGRTRADRRL
jgi:cysteine desulfurase/selenocysteine lyase